MHEIAAAERAWRRLKQFTSARIALGRTGASLPTNAVLQFGLAHAKARDAVYTALDEESLRRSLAGRFTFLSVRSAAATRKEYLRRPDLGRRLSQESRAALHTAGRIEPGCTLFVVADGLSALGVERNAASLLQAFSARDSEAIASIIVFAHQARVAIGDEIGELLGARAVVMLIGERPGLSAPDSLGAYLTYAPTVGRTDAERNCVSNIREGGLPATEAARRLHLLLGGARKLGRSGIDLKDTSGPRIDAVDHTQLNR